MSSISPISVRIASKTRFYETTGDSSYYYSSQLLNNMALLKAVTKLGQQLGWPSKVLDNQKPKAKQGSAFLAKASQSAANSRIEPLINLRATPGKEWVSANSRLVEKLTTSQQFFNSKAVGFLAKGLGRSGKFDSAFFFTEKQSYITGSAKTKDLLTFAPFARSSKARGSSKSAHSSQTAAREENLWFTSFNYLAQLAKYCNSRYYKQPLNRNGAYVAAYDSSATFAPLARSPKHPRLELQTTASFGGAGFTKVKEKLGFSTNKKGLSNNMLREPQTPYKAANHSQLLQKKSITKQLRQEAKQAFKTPVGLSFYLTALGLVGNSQILRTSLVIAPIISGFLQSNLLLADHKEIIKTASSNGIGLVSTSPKCYISRSSKDTVLNFFFKIPAKLAEKRANNRLQYQQVYVLADLQGLRKPQKRLKPAYASVRWL